MLCTGTESSCISDFRRLGFWVGVPEGSDGGEPSRDVDFCGELPEVGSWFVEVLASTTLQNIQARIDYTLIGRHYESRIDMPPHVSRAH